MNRSLQRHLSLMLALAIFLIGLLASLASFYFAYTEAVEFQDDSLRQIAALTVGNGADEKRLDAANRVAADPESRIRIIRLPQDPTPAWLPASVKEGFHTLDAESGRMRVFVRDARSGGRVIIAQPTDARDEIAFNSALRTLLPMLVLLPVLVWLVFRIVRRELAGVRRLSERLDSQSAVQLHPLPERDLPDEIAPFVQAINRLLERVNRMVSEQRRFIADAAHELRSPLTALSLQVQNLEHAESQETVRERVAPLKAGIERARCLTEQLLSLARMQADVEADTAIDVSAMVRELIVEYLPMAEAKGIDLGLEEKAPLSVRTLSGSLRLIIKNALENALKYTPDGGEVTLRILSDNDGVAIEVVDTGPGIPPADRERVFDAFHRLPGVAGQGSGLGLAIAREAAIRLGGEISLQDREDTQGLIFRFHLPLSNR
jgi:two-component system OmpR family sensor kinase